LGSWSPQLIPFVKYVTLLLAPIPAIIGSILLMRSAQVSTLLWVQQIAIAAICFAACAVAHFWRPATSSKQLHGWVIAVFVTTAIAVIAPLLLSSSSAPHRWISVGGFRLYAASAVLPAALLCLASAPPRQHALHIVWVGVIALALAVQPDAAQVTAFSIAAAVALLRMHQPAPYKIFVLIALIACSTWAWTKPDPLQPVPHVEGVVALAAAAGGFALAAALVSLAIPIACLVWLASFGQRAGNSALIVVAVYYVCIGGFATAQITPMPLLGFGAGPIIGYFLMVFVYARTRGAGAA
jgi:cell division protein FtsW (lipid II flippase)